MKKMIQSALVLCILFISITTDAQKKKPAPLTLTEKNNGKTVKVRKNQSFRVLFKKECIGCAQSWKMADAAGVTIVDEKYSNPSCTNCTGGNQDHTFILKATKLGKTNLSFDYFDQNYHVILDVK